MKKEERLKKQAIKLALSKSFDRTTAGPAASYIGGADEVGRGPLAGPVLCCCLVLPEDFEVLGVDDSKKLSEKKREELAGEIEQRAIAIGYGMRDNDVIDKINILEATKEAMRDAIENANKILIEKTGSQMDAVLIDALEISGAGVKTIPVVKGDSKSLAIGAASIMAKVRRDHMMYEYDEKYPGYDFASNKGYGTKAHYAGIEKQGITPIHRKSFLKGVK